MRESTLWLYRTLTRPARSRLLAELRQAGTVPVAILFYHRVADKHSNDWTISCDNFRRHLDWLQTNYDVVSLAEAQRRIRAPLCDRPTVSLTFDDGYSDNATFAIPEIVRRGLTCTYFVSSNFVMSGCSFPHDASADVPLPPNTLDELQDFVRDGIEIGAHTRSHADVGQLSKLQIIEEVGGSIDDLERWLKIQVRYFAFPYGLPHNISQAAIDYLVTRGIAGFCSAYGAFNMPNQPGYHLRRIHGDPGIERLKNWLTFDSRKLQLDPPLAFTEPTLQQQASAL